MKITIVFQTDAESFSFLPWKAQKFKSFFPKKIFFMPYSLNMPRQIQKMALAILIFSEGFGFHRKAFQASPRLAKGF